MHAFRESTIGTMRHGRNVFICAHGDVTFLAGDAICGHLLKAPLFTSSTRLGIYLHCAALREVDTALLVDAALHRGALHPVADSNLPQRDTHLAEAAEALFVRR